MAAGAGKNVESAGISSEDVDVAAVFEALKEEVRGRPRTSPDGVAGPLAARAEAERLWPVAVDTPIARPPGARGWLVYRVKSTLRRLMSWYVGPFAADQRNFNAEVLRLVDELDDRARASTARLEALELRVGELTETLTAAELPLRGERLRELEDRVLRLERARREQAATPTAETNDGEARIDYFVFEARMRGSTADIRERQRPYVDDFRDAAPVLDIGCGRGEFLGLLGEAGIDARGVEADPDMASFAAGEGLDVATGDGLAYLDGLEDGSLGGIFSAQVVEHLPPPALVRLLELAARKLRPGGLFVAETINPLSPLSFRHYFADLTHAQPLVPETLVLLARGAGFARAEARFLNEPPPEERLRAVELPTDPAFDDARRALALNVARLNDLLFGPLDYALVARR